MKIIKRPQWKDFLIDHKENFDLALPAFYQKQAYFRSRNIFSFFFLMAILLGLFYPILFAIPLSFAIYFGFYYMKLQRMVLAFRFKRSFSKDRLLENRDFHWTYEMKNLSPFDSGNFVLRDYLGFHRNPSLEKEFSRGLIAGSLQSFNVKRKCNAGMGTFSLGPAQLEFSDPFGVLQFVLEEEESHKIRVLPAYGATSSIPVEKTSFRYEMGKILRKNPGRSINFTGLREYQIGDPVNHIAWKLSSKSDEVYVKEFERSSNESFCVILNLNPYHHVGDKGMSSFEDAKDLAMALLKQLLEDGHQVSFASQGFISEPANHMGTYENVAEHLSRRNPFDEDELQSVGFELDQFEELEEESSALLKAVSLVSPTEQKWLIVSPLEPKFIEEIEELAFAESESGREVNCLFIDLNPYLAMSASHIPRRMSHSIQPSIISINNEKRMNFYQAKFQMAGDSKFTKTWSFVKVEGSRL